MACDRLLSFFVMPSSARVGITVTSCDRFFFQWSPGFARSVSRSNSPMRRSANVKRKTPPRCSNGGAFFSAQIQNCVA